MMIVRKKTNNLYYAWELPEGWSNDIPKWAERAKINGQLVWLDMKKIWLLNGQSFVAVPGDYIVYDPNETFKGYEMSFCKRELFDKMYEECAVNWYNEAEVASDLISLNIKKMGMYAKNLKEEVEKNTYKEEFLNERNETF